MPHQFFREHRVRDSAGDVERGEQRTGTVQFVRAAGTEQSVARLVRMTNVRLQGVDRVAERAHGLVLQPLVVGEVARFDEQTDPLDAAAGVGVGVRRAKRAREPLVRQRSARPARSRACTHAGGTGPFPA
ncbi:MAG: hypothetical protein QM736_23495 [Vicinamibacterales bacterium]